MDRRNGSSLREAIQRNARAPQQRQQPLSQNRQRGKAGHAREQENQNQDQGQSLARAYRQARQSGHLNASTRNLTDFPIDVLRIHALLDADEKSWECQPLQKVDLSYNEIPNIPREISQLHYVASFKMRHNKLTEIPDEFFELSKLVSLDLSNNLLEGSLSDALGGLVNLRELSLEGNKITSLPESLGSLQHLESIRIEDNQLSVLPDTIGQLQRLRILSAHSNRLTALPGSFSQLTNVITLDLKKNALVSMGTAIERLSKLKFFDVRQNKLIEFPILPLGSPPIDQLMLGYNSLTSINEESLLRVKDSLTVLDLRDNKLQELPERFSHVYRVKTIDLSNNDLHDIPPGLGYLKYLDHILVDGNPLRSIRRSVISAGTQSLKKYLRTRGSPPVGVDTLEEEFDEFALRDMRQEDEHYGDRTMVDGDNVMSENDYLFRDAAASGSLQLVDMRLQALPEQICGGGRHRLGDTLTQLNISKNRLGLLPNAVGELHALQTLTAESCGLKAVDPSIAMLHQLQHLRLRKNFLTTEAVDGIFVAGTQVNCRHSLKELDLRNNYLTAVPAHCQFLVKVDTLLLSYNRIESLDGMPWANMRSLSVLSLADNQINSLGSVHESPLLTSLSLENNDLRQIPANLALCPNLRALYVVGNPQRSIRLSIVNEGPEAILRYLRNRLPMSHLAPTVPSNQTAPLRRPRDDERTRVNVENEPPNGQSGVVAAVSVPGPRSATTSIPPATGSFQRQFTSPNAADYKRTKFAAAVSSDAHVDLRATTSGTRISTSHVSAATPPQPPQTPFHALVSGTPASMPPAPSELDQVLKGYNERISELEVQLENFALSQAKKYALKKELAKVRSLKIRHLRSAGA